MGGKRLEDVKSFRELKLLRRESETNRKEKVRNVFSDVYDALRKLFNEHLFYKLFFLKATETLPKRKR